MPVQELKLGVLGPSEGATILYDAVVVYGVTVPGATVVVNELDAEVDEEGRFQVEVTLVAGQNRIEVTATETSTGSNAVTIEVTSLALPPLPLFLLVTEPVDQTIVDDNPVRVSGRTTPDAVVSVNGVSLEVDELGIFSTTVAVEEGPNIIDVVATDPEGAVLDTVLAIIYRPSE